MDIRRFQKDRDFDRLETYLRDRYLEHRDAVSWLPERLHDLVYRVGAQEEDEGIAKSSDYIFLWEDGGKITACVLPDGENVYFSIKDGYEDLLPSMISFSEEHCLPLFSVSDDGSVKFWVAVSGSLDYMRRTLEESGYTEYPEKEYMNCANPKDGGFNAELPDGFRLMYGEEYPGEENKWSALRLGFHPELEATEYRASMDPYSRRKQSSLYGDSFECIVTEEDPEDSNDVCAYCFVYVDMQTKTALIEPVSTREKYRHRGIGTAMMHGALRRCRELGIEKCYVDSFGQRKDFYAACGFTVEDSIEFWYRTLK